MSVRISMKVDTSKLETFNENVRAKLNEVTFAAIVNNSPIFSREMKAGAPRGKTGDLITSITIERQPDKVLIGPTVSYAPFVIRGTGPSPGRYVPAIEKRLVNPLHPSFGEHPGIQPNPFIEAAAQAGAEQFREQIKRRIQDFLSQSSGRLISG